MAVRVQTEDFDLGAEAAALKGGGGVESAPPKNAPPPNAPLDGSLISIGGLSVAKTTLAYAGIGVAGLVVIGLVLCYVVPTSNAFWPRGSSTRATLTDGSSPSEAKGSAPMMPPPIPASPGGRAPTIAPE